MPKFDFTNADESGGYEAMPKGTYAAEVSEIDPERETSDESKKFPNAPMTSITFAITEEGYDNRNVWLNLVFPEGKGDDAKKQRARSAGRVKQLCRASGNWTEEDLESKTFELDWDDLMGAKVSLKLVAQKGGDGNNIVAILPFDATDDDEDELP